MKKIALIFPLLVFTLATLSAQTPIRFGVQASPTWSWMKTTDKELEGTGSNWGFKFGVLGEFYFSENAAFSTGLGFGFNQGGSVLTSYESADLWNDSPLSEQKYHFIPKDGKYHYRLTYVEIPFGLKLRGGTDEKIKYYAEIPTFTLGFMTRAQGDIRGTDDANTEDEDMRDDVNGTSLSWGFGGGIEYNASGTIIMLGIHFQQQFTDMTDPGLVQRDPLVPDLTEEDSKGTLNLISLRAGVFF